MSAHGRPRRLFGPWAAAERMLRDLALRPICTCEHPAAEHDAGGRCLHHDHTDDADGCHPQVCSADGDCACGHNATEER